MGLFETWLMQHKHRAGTIKKIRKHILKKKKRPARSIPGPLPSRNEEKAITLEQFGSHKIHKQHLGCRGNRENEDGRPRKRRKKSLERLENGKEGDNGREIVGREDGNCESFRAPPTDDAIQEGTLPEDEFEHLTGLRLVRTLQSKDAPLERKIELAFLFVEYFKNQEQTVNVSFQWEKSWMSMPQLVLFLCDWIQSILISSARQNTAPQKLTHRDILPALEGFNHKLWPEAFLDVRCWVVFKWCLQSKYVERASFSPNLMRPLNSVLAAAAAFPCGVSNSERSCIPNKSVKPESEIVVKQVLMKEFTEVVMLLFSLHGRYFRPTLDLWASSALAAVSLVRRVFSEETSDDQLILLLKLAGLILEAFSKFLGSHPNPRNAFPIIVEKLLEPLLSLLADWREKFGLKECPKNDIAYIWRIKLLRIVEDVFANGLFHSVHIDGYLNICKIDKCSESQRSVTARKKDKLGLSRKHEREGSNGGFTSYHKSLFQKFDQLRTEGRATTLYGIGWLLRIFICRKRNQGAVAPEVICSGEIKASRISGDYQEISKSDQEEFQERSIITGSFTKAREGVTEIGKACESKHTAIEPDIRCSQQEEATTRLLFNLFGEFLEPLRLDLERCIETVQVEEGVTFAQMSHVQSVVAAVNSLLAVAKDEKIYRPTEDTPEQAHFNFLKKIYSTVYELGAMVPSLWLKLAPVIGKVDVNGYDKSLGRNQHIVNVDLGNILTLIMKEVICALGYLEEIEYSVAEDELFHLWLLLLSYLSLDSSGNCEEQDNLMLTWEIVQLGCRIISIYSELRQVDRPLFSLFRSIRSFTFFSCTNSVERARRRLMLFIDSLPSTLCIGAVTSLVCSQVFQNVVAAVVAVVPEGQVAQCIRLLKMDFMESLAWMKIPSIKNEEEGSQIMEFQNKTKQDSIVQAEVIGKALCELYTLILDKSNVTINNSIQVGSSVKEMVGSVSPCLGTLVDGALKDAGNRWQCVLSIFTGKEIPRDRKHVSMNMQSTLVGASWVMVFIFRLYISCRSLYRQCICLMPPNPGKKASLAMGDPFTAYSGNDWIQKRATLAEGGYFSWIGKPSVPIQSVLMTVSESLEQHGFERVSALLYVLHNIALQRLVDLNRQHKALQFLHNKSLRLTSAMTQSDTHSIIQHKERKHLEKLLDVSKQEASALTDFILKYIFSIVKEKIGNESCLVDVSDKNEGGAQSSSQHSVWNSIIGTLNINSLATGIWQLLCENVDIWSCHASKKSMKRFAAKLLGSLLPCLRRVRHDVGMQHVREHLQHEEKIVTMEDISLELLRNTVLYEQKFFCRYLAPKICQKLKKSSPSRFNPSSFLGISSTEVVFGDLRDWTLVVSMLEEEIRIIGEPENSSHESTGKNEHGPTLVTLPLSEVAVEENQVALASSEETFGDWISLLNLLCWLPKGYNDVKCLSMYVRHILDIERFLVISFLRTRQQSSFSDLSAMLKSSGIDHAREYLELFLACRRALKSLAISFSEDEVEVRRSSLVPILLENSSSCLWLLRSVDAAAGCFYEWCSIWQSAPQAVQEDRINSGKEIIFSILGYTSGMLMLICEDLFKVAARSLICHAELTSGMHEGKNLSNAIQNFENDLKSERKEHMDVQTPIDVLAKTLVIQARNMLVFLKQNKFEIIPGSNELTSTSKCKVDEISDATHGLEAEKINYGSWIGVIALTCGIKSILLGLASALDNLDEQCRRDKTGSLKWRCDLLSKWEHRVEDFEYFINFCINKFLVGHGFDETSVVERDAVPGRHGGNAPSGQDVDAELLEEYDVAEEMENEFGQEQESKEEEEKDEEEKNKLDDYLEEDENDGIENDNLEGPNFQCNLDKIDLHALKDNGQFLDFSEIPDLNRSLLRKMLKGERPDEANLLGELFIALAGVVKLKHLSSSPKVLESKKVSHSASLTFLNLHVRAAYWLISEAATMTRSSKTFSLGWLVGIVRYLESIGSFIPFMNPVFPHTVYAKLINLHIQAMAAVSFPYYGGKKNLVSHENGYSNNNFHALEDRKCNNSSASEMETYSLNGLKAALQSSFSILLRKPLRLHLILALQCIQRALTGVWEDYNIVSGLHTGSPRGGKVGRIVAAGVECFNLALESVSGPKRLKLLAKYSSNFVAALINIIVHLQGPYIFFGNSLDHCQDYDHVDPASVILTCVEVLSKVASRHVVFPMNAGHVGQSLAFPAILFQHFCQFKATSNTFASNQEADSVKGSSISEGSFVVERRLSVELYVACCRLLSSVLRHHKRESGHCIALLGDSLRILLFCLKTVEMDSSEKMGAHFWSMQEGIKCASWLRRVYEEMGQQKDIFGRYCSHILSDYICALSGYGPAKAAFNREIDGALRPGIYALVDACSPDDLQQLHAVLGEGPRRSALQTLRQDYEHHFKYTGKI